MPDLDPVVAAYFHFTCKAAYENGALLRRTVRVETAIIGGPAQFPRISRATRLRATAVPSACSSACTRGAP